MSMYFDVTFYEDDNDTLLEPIVRVFDNSCKYITKLYERVKNLFFT